MSVDYPRDPDPAGRVIKRLLLAHPDVVKYVTERVYPRVMPATSDLPLLTYLRQTTTFEPRLAGPQRVERPQFQIICWAKTHEEAAALAWAVREALDGFSGRLDGILLGASIIGHSTDFNEGALLHADVLDFQITNEVPSS